MVRSNDSSHQQSGRNTPVYPARMQSLDNSHSKTITNRPALRKASHSGNSVSFVGEAEEEEEDGDISDITTRLPNISSTGNMRTQSFSSAKAKLKPLLKKKSSDTPTVDLSKSMRENEGLGILSAPPKLDSHTRSSSGVSIVTTSSFTYRTTGQYRTGQSYNVSSMPGSRSIADSGDDLSSTQIISHRSPPLLHIRTHSNSSNLRVKSSSQAHLEYPQSASSVQRETFSAESMRQSGRSSFDSVFRRRTRTNTGDVDPVVAAALAREEWHAKEAIKQRVRAEREASQQEKIERQQSRMSENARRKDQEKRSRANTVNTVASSEHGSTLSAIKYSQTRPGLPIDKELELIRAGKRPPATRRSTETSVKKKARGTRNAFDQFFYDLHTAWLKLLRAIGLRRS